LRDVAVAAGLAVGNFEQCAPAGELELGSTKIKREGKLVALPREVFVEFEEIGSENGFGLLQLDRTRIQLLHASFKFKPHQAFCGSRKKERADRRRGAQAGQSFHDALQDSTRLA